MAPLALAGLALSACGEGGGAILTPGDDDDPPAACTDTTCGEVLVGLTDADGDFLSYAVDVVSIKLEKSNGTLVETLPNRQRVDFADLVDLTELVSAATIPNGSYVGATVRLDYGDAEITVEKDGLPVVAAVIDADGNSLDVVDLDVRLDDARRVVIAPGTPALLQLDFDLAATHVVDTLAVPVTATADPVLVASLVPLDERSFRVRGPLVSVDESAGSYVADLRPFNHRTARNGELTVLTTADTDFEVDGEALDATAALPAMEALGAGTPTAALGTWDAADRTFTAGRVLAGDSVPGATFDVVTGNVTSRAGDVLIVRGATIVRTDSSVVYARGDVRVRLDDATVVHADGTAAALDIDAISVGQRISAFGEATSSDVNPTLDATAGRVRLHRTQVSGFVRDVNAAELRVELFAIDGRNPAFFDFTGTGGSLLTDADPLDYQLDTGALDLDAFELDDPMRAIGFMTPFGDAPPDFTVQTLVGFDALRAQLGLGWGIGGTAAPFSSLGQSAFVVDTANPALGLRRFLDVGPRRQDVTTLGATLRIEPVASGERLYALTRARRVEIFREFDAFATRVSSLLNGGSRMTALTARGTFDDDDVTLTANYVAVSFVLP